MLTQSSPPVRRGWRWEYRKGCTCANCSENCQGRTWPHWVEVKEQVR